jgi:hypothetical protein
MPSSLSAPPNRGITAENSSQNDPIFGAQSNAARRDAEIEFARLVAHNAAGEGADIRGLSAN